VLGAAEASWLNGLFREPDFFANRSLDGSVLNGVLVDTGVLGLKLRASRSVYGGVIGRTVTFTIFTLSDINGRWVSVAVSVNLNTSVGILSTSWSERTQVSGRKFVFWLYEAVVSVSTELCGNRKAPDLGDLDDLGGMGAYEQESLRETMRVQFEAQNGARMSHRIIPSHLGWKSEHL
jgi:hypothetical protein